MAEHRATIDWQRGDADFSHAGYSRNHTVTFDNGVVVEASAAADYQGDPDKVDPEEMLVAALSNCHMLTFLAIAAKKRLVVESYRDEASGVLGMLENKRMAVTDVTLRPVVVFGGPTDQHPDADALAAIHAKAHEHCFIANSVTCAIHIEPA
ncbi:MAG: OsmC family protein [Planctomycetota bacterium]